MEEPKKYKFSLSYGSVQVFEKKKDYFEINVDTQEPSNQTNLEIFWDKIMISGRYFAPFSLIN
jgi:hypothetical protein